MYFADFRKERLMLKEGQAVELLRVRRLFLWKVF
jgi:hypothetical protein